MKIINGLGGSGTSFVIDALERNSSRTRPEALDPHEMTRRFNVSPSTGRKLRSALSRLGLYSSNLRILRRPDTFWTDWASNPSGRYSPEDANFGAQVLAQRDYLVRTARTRSAGLPIRREDLSTGSLTELVGSYLQRLEAIECEIPEDLVLVSGHWGEYGILRELGVETLYIVRDPFNSVVSHSKSVRHEKDYLRRGLSKLNSRSWIDNYLKGPHHYWIRHAESALDHANAKIIRYQHFATDWQEVEGLPDITADFEYRVNDIAGLLSRDLIDYIYDSTREICIELGFDEIYHELSR